MPNHQNMRQNYSGVCQLTLDRNRYPESEFQAIAPVSRTAVAVGLEKSLLPLSPRVISVIIPAHNAATELPRCLASVLSQEHNELEVLVIDDGSQDETYSICKAFAAQDDRVRVFRIEHSGPSAARNHGLEEARGAFVCFVDADDYLEKAALTTLYDNLHAAQSDLAIGGFSRRGEGGELIEDVRQLHATCVLEGDEVVTQACRYLEAPNRHVLFAYSWGRLFKTHIIQANGIRFDSRLRTYEDVAFNFCYLRHVQRLSYTPLLLYTHVIHSTASSATFVFDNNPERLFGFPSALENIATFLYATMPRAAVDRKVGHAYVVLTIIQLVRICSQWRRCRKTVVRNFVAALTRDRNLLENLAHYRPKAKDSRLVPLLIRAHLPWLLICLCRFKAWRRYSGRPTARSPSQPNTPQAPAY